MNENQIEIIKKTMVIIIVCVPIVSIPYMKLLVYCFVIDFYVQE